MDRTAESDLSDRREFHDEIPYEYRYSNTIPEYYSALIYSEGFQEYYIIFEYYSNTIPIVIYYYLLLYCYRYLDFYNTIID
jgi:hypothetical protein